MTTIKTNRPIVKLDDSFRVNKLNIGIPKVRFLLYCTFFIFTNILELIKKRSFIQKGYLLII